MALQVVMGKSSLYVGELHPEVVEEKLLQLFSGIGPVESVRVCRDYNTSSSRCYGYVNYYYAIHAKSAIELLNHAILCGQPIRVMWSIYDPESRRSGLGNVFVKNLSGSIDAIKLRELFFKFGTISSCKVVIQDEKSKGYGFVQFDSPNSAKLAIQNLNGLLVDGKKIYAGDFIKKCDREALNPKLNHTNLYMKNLDPDVTEERIELKFSEYGKLVNVFIAKDDKGNSKGFGFVNFVNPESARKAVEMMNGFQLGSQKLYVAMAQKKEERREILRREFADKRNREMMKNEASNLYVKNIDESVDDKALWEYFSRCGNITSAKVMRGDRGISRGFGFVCFSTKEEAAIALKTLHGYLFHGKPLYIAIAQRKEERQAHLLHQYSQPPMVGLEGLAAANVVLPNTYSPNLYGPCGEVMANIPLGDGLLCPSFGPILEWQQGGFVHPSTQWFQHTPFPLIRGDMNPEEIAMFRNMVTASEPLKQKQILHNYIFPLVHKLKADLAGQITDILIEQLDTPQLLMLMESPESLIAAKVEEALQIFNLSNVAQVGDQEDALNSNNLFSPHITVT